MSDPYSIFKAWHLVGWEILEESFTRIKSWYRDKPAEGARKILSETRLGEVLVHKCSESITIRGRTMEIDIDSSGFNYIKFTEGKKEALWKIR